MQSTRLAITRVKEGTITTTKRTPIDVGYWKKRHVGLVFYWKKIFISVGYLLGWAWAQ